ncbi:MAG TPA: ATP-binding protein [Candidatus Paceibacterota bacterium]|nr:ATP-binding protein [Candidatus Paceibacterota bacterium]
MNGIRNRWFSRNLESALKVLPVTVVTGARQTGKTTLVRMLGAKRSFFTLDDFGVLDQAERNPDSLLDSRPVTLDEVQRAPQLLLAVKRAVDEQRRAGDFVLTGSANLLLMGRVADTLAGRAIYLELPPFCPAEWSQRKGALEPVNRLFAPDFDLGDWPDKKGNWQRWLLRGGFPPALAIESDRDRGLWFAAYVQTYLERDLRQLSDVASLPDFQRLMALAANRTGKLLNQADLARDAALSHPTAHRYLNLLETGCLITRIRPLAANPSSSMVKAPKLLWSDCGLAAWLAGIRSAEEIGKRLDSGFWLEQTIYQTLQSWRALDPTNRRIHYWRDRAGHEVDFILERDGKLVAVEIKASHQANLSDAAGIQTLKSVLTKKQSLVRSVVLHAGKARPLDKDVFALPWGWLVED